MNRDEGRKGGRQGGRLGRRLSEDENRLWHGVTKSVSPLRKRHAAKPKDSEHPPVAAPKAAPKKSVAHAPPPPVVAKPKPSSPPALAPLDRKTKSRIARGTREIDARIDLHGHTQAEAHDALIRFLRRARDKGARVVLVITGKGARGDGERGVLKRQVPMWLSLPEFRDLVVGFDDAAIGHGGEGALYVRVRKPRER